MSDKTLKELVAPKNIVSFTRYFSGDLWYRVLDATNDLPMDLEFEFPVPISDIGNATFLAEDRAPLFMRYIRRHLTALAEAKAAQDVQDPPRD